MTPTSCMEIVAPLTSLRDFPAGFPYGFYRPAGLQMMAFRFAADTADSLSTTKNTKQCFWRCGRGDSVSVEVQQW
jgi:hypothetical protein